jgi:hypothetical protein
MRERENKKREREREAYNLQLDDFLVDVDGTETEINTNRRNVGFSKVIILENRKRRVRGATEEMISSFEKENAKGRKKFEV